MGLEMTKDTLPDAILSIQRLRAEIVREHDYEAWLTKVRRLLNEIARLPETPKE